MPKRWRLLDFGAPNDPRAGRGAQTGSSSAARRRDALTLWHLLTRGTIEERRRRLRSHGGAGAAAGAASPVDAVLRADRRATDRWWNALGLDNASWWRIWMREW